MRSIKDLPAARRHFTRPGYFAQKKAANHTLIAQLTSTVSTKSAVSAFDLYTRQTYLDNLMRGGWPFIFKSPHGRTVFYLYARKHGDLERDYNRFHLQPTYFSQGNGNYRDMNQNRRMDVWFNPEIGDETIFTFINLLQTDGFNPLVIKGTSFTLDAGEPTNAVLGLLKTSADRQRLKPLLAKPFTPGEIALVLEEAAIDVTVAPQAFLQTLFSRATAVQEAEHGEGFWTDHWTYNLDLIEHYLGVYPERRDELLFEKRSCTFYDNAEVVQARSHKYCLFNGQPRQLHAVTTDPGKREMIRKRHSQPHTVRTHAGTGEIYHTTVCNKLLCLVVNKYASLDPFGCGIEMEADKPNWFDSLNGLPALFGSSLNETFELARLLRFLRQSLEAYHAQTIMVTEEFFTLLTDLREITERFESAPAARRDFIFWDQTHTAKEAYWQRTRLGLTGNELAIKVAFLNETLALFTKKVMRGINRSRVAGSALYYGYFIYEPARYTLRDGHYVVPGAFRQKKMPLFLEAQVHALRVCDSPTAAETIIHAVRQSPLYDRKLKMYKVTASLASMPEGIGRCRIFSPGWLENESIWLHMEYKYLLEILKSGLTALFYREFKNILIPFQPAGRYGRSILENSSFLVSSAFADPALHGHGYVARLSGSTAEFLQMWLLMNIGPSPFFLNESGALSLRFEPRLAGWLFTKEKPSYTFTFLGTIPVTYHNPLRKDTFGPHPCRITAITLIALDGKTITFDSPLIPSPFAERVRTRAVSRIDILLT